MRPRPRPSVRPPHRRAPAPADGDALAARDGVPYVDEGLGVLVEQAYREVVGRPPTRAEKLSTVAGLQSDPRQAAVLADLVRDRQQRDPRRIAHGTDDDGAPPGDAATPPR